MLKISYRNSHLSFDITNASIAINFQGNVIVTTYKNIFRDASILNFDMEMLIVTTYKNIFRDASKAILDMEMLICIIGSFLGMLMCRKFILHFTTIINRIKFVAIGIICAYCLKTMLPKLEKYMKI